MLSRFESRNYSAPSLLLGDGLSASQLYKPKYKVRIALEGCAKRKISVTFLDELGYFINSWGGGLFLHVKLFINNLLIFYGSWEGYMCFLNQLVRNFVECRTFYVNLKKYYFSFEKSEWYIRWRKKLSGSGWTSGWDLA